MEKIKDQYRGCVVSITDPILGVRTIEVDRIRPEQIPQLKKYGFSFIFEVIKEPEIILGEPELLSIKATENPQVEWIEIKPKRKRKRKTNE
jgi:hypothetical protein